MAADTTTTTDGRHELRFLHAALARDAAGLVAALGDSAGAARGGRATGMANLPGTGYAARPSKVDIDGFKCLVRYGVFRSHIPPQLFATLGPPIPQSGRMQAYGSGLRYQSSHCRTLTFDYCMAHACYCWCGIVVRYPGARGLSTPRT
jgi:hypothetical protein